MSDMFRLLSPHNSLAFWHRQTILHDQHVTSSIGKLTRALFRGLKRMVDRLLSPMTGSGHRVFHLIDAFMARLD
jgi:hypothetical protein